MTLSAGTRLGAYEVIYVRPFPAVEAGRWQVSTAGGSVPQWARNGRELFYIDGSGAMTSAPVQTTPAFVAGQPTKLFDARFSSGAGRRYEVTADGKRFLMVKEDAATQRGGIASIVVVQGWLEERKRLVPVK